MAKGNVDLISKRDAERMLLCVKEYEAIKRKESKTFKTVKEFCEYHKFSHQNFMKVYHRYKENPVIETFEYAKTRTEVQNESDNPRD